MRSSHDDKATPQAVREGQRSRREYAAPKLTQWGNIHTLTQGGAGGVIDLPASVTRKDT